MDISLLRSVPFFAALGESDLERIRAATVRKNVPAGDSLFAEGAEAHHAYVIVSGELEILKRSSGRDILLAVRGPGDVIGEMSLLEDAPRMAGVTARSDAVVLEIPRNVFEEVLETSPKAARGLFGVLLGRGRETEARLRQREQLAQLGTLSAGLAHELNNPAAAAKRAAAGFSAATARLAATALAVERLGDKAGATRSISRVTNAETRRLGPMARADRQEHLADRLSDLGIEAPMSQAATLAEVDPSVVDQVLDSLGGIDTEQAAAVIAAATARRDVAALTAVALDATTRISDIVGAIRAYAYTGQAPVQEVSLAQMLDNTLVLLAHKLGDIEVTRDYELVAPFPAYGSELNQVWTNLIDNAADAVVEANRSPGRIVLRTRVEGDQAVVEVEDNGAGIPDEVLPRVFDSFFTTKAPGSGTGLGLDISYGIVVQRHSGEIEITSEEGRTTVRVHLPMMGPTA